MRQLTELWQENNNKLLFKNMTHCDFGVMKKDK